MSDRILAETPYLRLIDRDGWYFVERPNARDVVILIAVTPQGHLLLLEQFRPALDRWIVELPAGLVGDEPDRGAEPLLEAAGRELIEETGWQASSLTPLLSCASAPGMASETVTYVRARGLQKVGPGGGVGGEQIRVHEVPLAGANTWIAQRAAEGLLVSVQVYAGLWLEAQHPG
jgi:ADP-ribose pyrophosphatase